MIVPREILKSGATEFGVELGDHQLDQFDRLTELLLEWNSKFNLTRITDPGEIAIKHYLDSLSVLPVVRMSGRASLIDVGTGAGFPGIPLKIALPDLRLTLLDSSRKRLTFLEAMCQDLELSAVNTIHARAEDAGRDKTCRGQFDFAVARAVARLSVLAELCIPFCRKGGRFVAYKGPDAKAEIDEAGKAIRILRGEVEAVRELVLPHSDAGRTLIVIRKIGATSGAYPRNAGVPARDPLL
jgi:16S rRNA (guanine527-N7)-methyltransferase